jgi:hypothetical protein
MIEIQIQQATYRPSPSQRSRVSQTVTRLPGYNEEKKKKSIHVLDAAVLSSGGVIWSTTTGDHG